MSELETFDYDYNRAWEEGIEYTTLITQMESGKEQRRSKGEPRRTFRLTFEKSNTSSDDAQDIWDFYKARLGRFEPFYFPWVDAEGNEEDVKVRFDTDTLSRNTFLKTIYNFGLRLREVLE